MPAPHAPPRRVPATISSQQASGRGYSGAVRRARARPLRAACLLPPGMDPAALKQRRSGGERAGGHGVWRCRQDQSESLPPGCPCRAAGQRMEGRGTLPSPRYRVGAGRAADPPQALVLAGPPPRPAHLLHGRTMPGSNTAGTARRASSTVPVLVPGRCWLGTGVPAAGRQAGGRQVPHGAISSRWRRPLEPLSRARSHKVYGPHHLAVMEIVKSVSV